MTGRTSVASGLPENLHQVKAFHLLAVCPRLLDVSVHLGEAALKMKVDWAGSGAVLLALLPFARRRARIH